MNKAKQLLSKMEEASNAKVLKGYLTAALWSSTDDEGNPLDDDHTIRDIDKRSIKQAEKDIAAFMKKATAGGLLDGKGIKDDQIGHDFWLTRNGHGSGFWDNEKIYGDANAKSLADLADDFGELNPYASDGKVYIE